MKRFILLLVALNFIYSSQAQKLSAYLASNGVMYHEKDTVSLGNGSALDHSFRFLQIGGIYAVYHLQNGYVGKRFANKKLVIRSIKTQTIRGVPVAYFLVSGNLIGNLILIIEPAIQTGEVIPCEHKNEPLRLHEVSPENYDLLKKLSDSLERGLITQDKYDFEYYKIIKERLH